MSIMSILKSTARRILRRPFHFLERQLSTVVPIIQKKLGIYFTKNEIFIVGDDIENEQIEDLKKRINFYLPDVEEAKIKIIEKWPLRAIITLEPVLIFGPLAPVSERIKRISTNYFYINYLQNPTDGWEWIRLVNYYYKHVPDLSGSKEIFKTKIKRIKEKKLSKCYVFGTGPSLEKAIEKDWSDGYRIVCNTIVRDPILWNHLKPHFIVAGDAIYHFGHTDFAKAFRADLKKRLQETDTFFVYPELFDKIVRREMSHFSGKLIPVPFGRHKNIHVDLTEIFELPNMGNVLPLLLLPLGCTLSKRVLLWGFDGRSPHDNQKFFWSNSNKHSYEELMPKLKAAHPRFFDHFVPREDLNRYVSQVHGKLLEERLCEAEKLGYDFIVLHHSWTPSLQKRFKPS